MSLGKFVFVVNPRSANGATMRRFERMRARFDSRLGGIDVRLTERPMHAAELARAAVQDGAKCVVAVGGDGTNNEVVNGFFDAQGELLPGGTALGIVTSGTGGDFRRTLKWTDDPDDALRRLERFETKLVDVGRLRCDGGATTRMFLNSASCGLVGDVVEKVNTSSKALGPVVSFVAGAVKGIAAFAPARVRVTIDDDPPQDLDATFVVAANGQYFGGGMRIAPDALPFDGFFHVVVIAGVGKGFLARHALKVYSGAHVALPEVKVKLARRVAIEPLHGARVLVECDGEQPGRLPAVYELVPAAIPLVV